MDTTALIFTCLLSVIISILIMYFIIKSAVKESLREFGSENRSMKDISVIQTKLLAEIAKKSGVTTDEINNILFPQQNYSFEK